MPLAQLERPLRPLAPDKPRNFFLKWSMHLQSPKKVKKKFKCEFYTVKLDFTCEKSWGILRGQPSECTYQKS